MKNSKALVVFSGGQDSTTCLLWAKKEFEEVRAIIFDYGQKHVVEVDQAKKICSILNIQFEVLKTDILASIGDSALVTKGNVNVEHSRRALPASWVPNRNGFFLLVAHAVAQKLGFKNLVTGVCQTDYSGYPDCRQEFLTQMINALNTGSLAEIDIHAPLMYLTKGEIFALAEIFGGLDIVLEHSLTCYNGDETKNPWGFGCGKCPSCKLRAKGYSDFMEEKENG